MIHRGILDDAALHVAQRPLLRRVVPLARRGRREDERVPARRRLGDGGHRRRRVYSRRALEHHFRLALDSSHYELAVAERETEVAATNQQLESVRTQLEAKENDAATQRQQQELVSKYSERLRNLQTEIKTLKKRQREYAQMERINRERCSEIGRLQSQVIWLLLYPLFHRLVHRLL